MRTRVLLRRQSVQPPVPMPNGRGVPAERRVASWGSPKLSTNGRTRRDRAPPRSLTCSAAHPVSRARIRSLRRRHSQAKLRLRGRTSRAQCGVSDSLFWQDVARQTLRAFGVPRWARWAFAVFGKARGPGFTPQPFFFEGQCGIDRSKTTLVDQGRTERWPRRAETS